MDIKTQGYYEDKVNKAKSALRPIVNAIREGRNPNDMTTPMVSLIRDMIKDGCEDWRIRNYLLEGAERVGADNGVWIVVDDTLSAASWETTKRIVNNAVDRQLAVTNGRGRGL